MKRSVRLTAAMWGAALLLIVIALASLIGALVNGSTPSVTAAALVPADATTTPIGSPTPAAVPTISAGSAGSISPAAPPLAGATIATALTCVTTVIGLILAVVTLTILLRGGYGPFLRALIFGGKKGKQDADGSADGGAWDASHTLNYHPGPSAHDDPFASYNAYDEPASSRRGSSSRGGSRRDRRDRRGHADGAGVPRGRSGARRHAPTRSRERGWE